MTTVALDFGLDSVLNKTGGENSNCDVQESRQGGVRILPDNYGSTCKLQIELSHVYISEENFNISVMAGLEGRTIVRNWTVIRVRLAVEVLSLSVDAVVTVSQNVTVTALLSPPASQFLTVHWTVTQVDLMKNGMNSSTVIPSTGADVAELVLMFAEAGDYLINVTVANELGTSTADTIVTAAEPVYAVSLLCITHNYFSVDVDVVKCTASVEQGTEVGFLWNFDDDISVQITNDNSSSTAVAAFPAAGQYNVTVTAWNSLGAKMAQTVVDIAVESEFKLSAMMAAECVLVGKPVILAACCVPAISNLTLLFDFGSGKHRILLDPGSHMATVSHIYRTPGEYTVSVKAEHYGVSIAETHVVVNVIEEVADVELQPVSELVVGRHSLFMAAFRGSYIFYLNLF